MSHERFWVTQRSKFSLKDFDPGFTGKHKSKSHAAKKLRDDIERLAKLQDVLWASRSCRVLIILQALDAAGKDGTIKHVMTGVNPQGCRVTSFRAPSPEELKHPFLWRAEQALPRPGEIAIFNRSYYEEVLAVRVHPEFLKKQPLTAEESGKDVWQHRFMLIREFERKLVRDPMCPTIILKFYLNQSKEEQRRRFLDRIEDPKKNWKFNMADVRERRHWPRYMQAYGEMLQATSTAHAPWYVIPADHKWFTRMTVADIITKRLKELNLQYPTLDAAAKNDLERARKFLKNKR